MLWHCLRIHQHAWSTLKVYNSKIHHFHLKLAHYTIHFSRSCLTLRFKTRVVIVHYLRGGSTKVRNCNFDVSNPCDRQGPHTMLSSGLMWRETAELPDLQSGIDNPIIPRDGEEVSTHRCVSFFRSLAWSCDLVGICNEDLPEKHWKRATKDSHLDK